MICDELSNASLRFVLRRLAAELDGESSRRPPPRCRPRKFWSTGSSRVTERFLRKTTLKTAKAVIDKHLIARHELPSCGNGAAVSGFAMFKESSGSSGSGLSNPW